MDVSVKAFRAITGVLAGLATLALMALVWGYRILLAPLFPASCRYNPSCSAYALEALRRHGALRGAWIAALRLARCHPWGDYGYDPVPDAPKSRRPAITGRN